MNRKNNTARFHHRLHLCILKRLVIFANVMGLATYAFLRIMFYDLPFMLQEELLIILNIIGWSTGIAVAISFAFFAGDAIIYLIRNRKHIRFHSVVQVREPAIDKKRAA